MSRHPVLAGVGLTLLVWLAAIALGASAPSLAAGQPTGIGALGILFLSSALFGIPGALLAGYLSRTDSRVGQCARGFAASAGGGILAIGLVVLVFQVGRGVGPALEAGTPGAAIFSLVTFGLIGLFLVAVDLAASILAAPAALLGSWLRQRRP